MRQILNELKLVHSLYQHLNLACCWAFSFMHARHCPVSTCSRGETGCNCRLR